MLTLPNLHALAASALRGAGLTPPHAEVIARVLVAGQRDACHSHGLFRLPWIVHTLKAGKASADAEPAVTDASPALVRVDAGFGFSPLAFERGLPILVEKAKAVGLAALVVNRCFHVTALWPEVEAVAEQGLAALALTPSYRTVAPAGGSKPLLGTNPIAFAWPRPGERRPFVFDFATSMIARGDVELHARAGKAIPEGWGVDSEGRPTTDPAAALSGALLTFGGHKGSALSFMVELLAGALIGDLTSTEATDFDAGARAAPFHGELILAFDPARFSGGGPEAGVARAEALFAAAKAQGARLPSERRYAARARSLEHGVEVPQALLDEILALPRG